MPRLVFRAAALRDLAQIASYIESESGSRETAEAFVGKLIDHCEQIALRPQLMGRPRPELRADYRSLTFGNYVIFIRYADEEGPRSHLYVGNVVHGRRDLDAYFSDNPLDDDAG